MPVEGQIIINDGPIWKHGYCLNIANMPDDQVLLKSEGSLGYDELTFLFAIASY